MSYHCSTPRYKAQSGICQAGQGFNASRFHGDLTADLQTSNEETEPPPGFEPGTSSLPWMCSTTELRRQPSLSNCDCRVSNVVRAPLPFNSQLENRGCYERETGFEPATFTLEG